MTSPAQEPTPAEQSAPIDIAPHLARVERLIFVRIAIALVVFVAFAVLGTVAAVTHSVHERSPLLFGLLIGAILALPRRPVPGTLIARLPATDREAWTDRAARIQRWMSWTRALFFGCALIVFLVLPEAL